MSPNVMEMGRAGSAFLNTASSRRVRHKPCRTQRRGEREEVTTGVDGGGEHLVTAQGVGSGALTPQHLPWSSRQLCEVRGGRGSQPVPTPCTRVDEPASRPPELGRCYQTTSPGRVTCDV